MTDFAKLLAKRGLTVSIITTPANLIRSKPALDRAVQAGLKIKMIPLEFPGQESGLPPGCENMDSLSSKSQVPQFFQARMLMQAPLEKMITELDPKPSCIISSNFLTWTMSVSEKFEIPWYVFETISCFSLIWSYILSQDGIKERSVSDSGTIVVPDVPDRIEFSEAELPDQGVEKFGEKITKVRGSARAALVNSFEEMESGYLERYREKREREFGALDLFRCVTVKEWIEVKRPRLISRTAYHGWKRRSPDLLYMHVLAASVTYHLSRSWRSVPSWKRRISHLFA